MKSIMKFLVLPVLTQGALAMGMGPSTGGGGYAIQCPENPLEPAQTTLLDLYEGAAVLNFKMKHTSGSLEQDYLESVNTTYGLQGFPKLTEEGEKKIRQHLKLFFRSVKLVEKATDLPSANDLGALPYIPSQCHVTQVAYFDDNATTIYILKPIWNLMDPLNQAALVQHELHYRHKRRDGDTDSVLTRKAIAHIFAQQGAVPTNDGISDIYHRYILRDDFISVFHAIPSFFRGTPIVRIQFQHIYGYGLVTKTWADLAMPHWELKYKYGNQGRYCVVTSPNVNLVKTAPLKGGLYSDGLPTQNGFQVRVEYITNQPLKVSIVKPDGSVLTEGTLYSGSSCQTPLL